MASIIALRKVAHWELRLEAYLETIRRKKFRWGVHDCVTFVAGAVESMTGTWPLPSIEKYHTRRGAARALLKHTDLDLEDACDWVADAHGFISAHPSMLATGDVVLLRDDLNHNSLCIVYEGSPLAPCSGGLGQGNIEEAIRGWRILS